MAFRHCRALPSVKVPFNEALGRILADNVYSDTDIPGFNKSAMDGYACRREDLGNELKVLETIAAGMPPTRKVTQNCCSKIMTGAKIPAGADTVIIVEETEETGPGRIRYTGATPSANISYAGEDIRKGSRVLSKGTLVEPRHIAVLAAAGCINPDVFKQPGVGIISTGSELVEPEEPLSDSKIRNSNGHQLIAQLRQTGLNPVYYGIIRDNKQETLKIIKKSMEVNDLTLVSGGVSVGDFDYVPWAIREAGFTILFNKISVKPGQHTTFAVRKNSDENLFRKYVIGLPGNPVSTFIMFEIFVKPFLYKLQGTTAQEKLFPVPMAHGYERKNTGRTEFLPVLLNSVNQAELANYHGSAHIHAYQNASGFIMIGKDKKELKKGELVYVRSL